MAKNSKIYIKPSKRGSLRKALKTPKGEKIPAKDLKIKPGDSKAMKKKKIFAQNARKWKKAKEGLKIPSYYTGVQRVPVPPGGSAGDVVSSAAGLTATGAQLGSNFGPYGTAIGAGIGLGAGVYKGIRDKNTADMRRLAAMQTNRNIMQYGGFNPDNTAFQTPIAKKGMKIPKYNVGGVMGAANVATALPMIGGQLGADEETMGYLNLFGNLAGAALPTARNGMVMNPNAPMVLDGKNAMIIEAEGGELLVDAKTLKPYNSQKYKVGNIDMNEDGSYSTDSSIRGIGTEKSMKQSKLVGKKHSEQDAMGNTGEYLLAQEGMAIIPAKYAEKFMKGDSATRNSILSKLPREEPIARYGTIVPQFPMIPPSYPEYQEGTSGLNVLFHEYGRMGLDTPEKRQAYFNQQGYTYPQVADYLRSRGLDPGAGTTEATANYGPMFDAAFNTLQPIPNPDPVPDFTPINPTDPTIDPVAPLQMQDIPAAVSTRRTEPIGAIPSPVDQPTVGGETIPISNNRYRGYQALQTLPSLYNLGMGLFGGVDTLDLGRYTPQQEQYRDLSERDRKAALESRALARENVGRSFRSRGQAQGALAATEERYLSRLGDINQLEARRFEDARRRNLALRNQAALTNLGFQQRETMYGKQAEAAKQRFLAKGLDQTGKFGAVSRREAFARDRDALADRRQQQQLDLLAFKYGLDRDELYDVIDYTPTTTTRRTLRNPNK